MLASSRLTIRTIECAPPHICSEPITFREPLHRTTTKGARFTDDELRRVEQLRAQPREYSSEADLLRHAALLGTLVLALYAARLGLAPYAGHAPGDLAALLKPRLMPALD